MKGTLRGLQGRCHHPGHGPVPIRCHCHLSSCRQEGQGWGGGSDPSTDTGTTSALQMDFQFATILEKHEDTRGLLQLLSSSLSNPLTLSKIFF